LACFDYSNGRCIRCELENLMLLEDELPSCKMPNSNNPLLFIHKCNKYVATIEEARSFVQCEDCDNFYGLRGDKRRCYVENCKDDFIDDLNRVFCLDCKDGFLVSED